MLPDAPAHTALAIYLVVAFGMFVSGAAIVLLRKNLILILMGLVIAFNACALLFAVFGRFVTGNREGQVIALVLTMLTQALLVCGLAVIKRLHADGRGPYLQETEEIRN